MSLKHFRESLIDYSKRNQTDRIQLAEILQVMQEFLEYGRTGEFPPQTDFHAFSAKLEEFELYLRKSADRDQEILDALTNWNPM